MKTVDDIYNSKFNKPWHPFIWLFIVASVLVVGFGFLVYFYSDEGFDWRGFHTEAIGMVLDILFLGIIWAVFEFYRTKRFETKRYLEEIDDFRDWQGEEASRRLSGAIRRLNDRGIFDFDLNCCYLVNGKLWGLKCTSEAAYVDFSGAAMKNAVLQNIDLSYSSFKNTDLMDSKLNGSSLCETNFEGAELYGVDFRGCEDIDKAFFWNSHNILKARFDDEVNIEELKKKRRQ